MKKLFSYLGLFSFMLFSFYFTEKIAILAQSKDPLLDQIKNYNSQNTTYVNAVIKDDTIIPGLNGRELDEIKSLMNMKKAGSFSESFLVYKSIIPKISLKDNLDKTIIKGNPNKQAISLVLEYNKELIKYLQNNNLSFSVLTTLDNYAETNNYEMINYENASNYKTLDKLLNKNNLNTNICLKESYCSNYKYLVEITHNFSKNTLLTIKNKITSGDIIKVSVNTRIEDLAILIQQIHSQNLSILPLSKLISEDY